MNSAGFASYDLFAEAYLANELRLIQVKVTALTALTGLLGPGTTASGFQARAEMEDSKLGRAA